MTFAVELAGSLRVPRRSQLKWIRNEFILDGQMTKRAAKKYHNKLTIKQHIKEVESICDHLQTPSGPLHVTNNGRAINNPFVVDPHYTNRFSISLPDNKTCFMFEPTVYPE